MTSSPTPASPPSDSNQNGYLRPQFDVSQIQKVGLLPIRGEKRLIPVTPAPSSSKSSTPSYANSYESITAVAKTLTDYVTVRLPNRFPANKNNPSFVFRFLVNPKSISVSHQTSDSLSLGRGGWQFGVWGEDTIDLNITGVTVGQYFQGGLEDKWGEYTASYRNLMELINIFENNGYWFEGESPSPSVFDSDFTRKRIKMHQDVELMVGNFIWKGVFTTFSLENSADTPFLFHFTIGFLAWREEYQSSSPWISPSGGRYRGHSYEVQQSILAYQNKKEKEQQAGASTPIPPLSLVTDPKISSTPIAPLSPNSIKVKSTPFETFFPTPSGHPIQAFIDSGVWTDECNQKFRVTSTGVVFLNSKLKFTDPFSPAPVATKPITAGAQ